MNREQQIVLRRNPLFKVGVVIILCALLTSLGGAFIRPDNSPFANKQFLELSVLKPMTTIRFLKVRRNEIIEHGSWLGDHFIGKRNEYQEIPVDSISLSGDYIVLTRYGQIKHEKIHLLDAYYQITNDDFTQPLTGTLNLIDGSQISYDIESLRANYRKDLVVEKRFVLGTDKYGRDVMSRLMSGAYISLSVGMISVFISLVLGIFLGMWAGYFRGWSDRVILWLINVVWSVPTLLLVIAITLVLGKGFWQIFVAVGLTMWVEVARIVRGQVLSIREKEFVEAGKVLGMSNLRIMVKHILPNISSPIIVISAANFATAILLEAGLSFLGIGAPPPQATWGKMISEHKAYLITGDAHLAIIPGIAIMLLVLSFTFIGNALRDTYDEKMVL
jgi:peptide/nickel transport system permease protein